MIVRIRKAASECKKKLHLFIVAFIFPVFYVPFKSVFFKRHFQYSGFNQDFPNVFSNAVLIDPFEKQFVNPSVELMIE